MTHALIIILLLSLAGIFCVRHFFVQLIALKLFLDSLIFIVITVRGSGSIQANNQAAGWLIGALSGMVFFILLTCGTRRFSNSRNLSLEESND